MRTLFLTLLAIVVIFDGVITAIDLYLFLYVPLMAPNPVGFVGLLIALAFGIFSLRVALK